MGVNILLGQRQLQKFRASSDTVFPHAKDKKKQKPTETQEGQGNFPESRSCEITGVGLELRLPAVKPMPGPLCYVDSPI